MTIAVKIFAVLISSVICSVFLKQYKNEYAIFASLAGAAVSLALLIPYVLEAADELKGYAEILGSVGEYLPLLIKAAAVCVFTQLISDACRDSGNSLLASAACVTGRLTIIFISLPLIRAVINIALSMLE